MKKNEFPILYEDEHIFAVHKPARVACVPGEGIQMHETVLGKVQKTFSSEYVCPYLLHRLDYETSGVLLFGKKESQRPLLEGIFKDPEINKKYVTLVRGVPRGSVITQKLSARTDPQEKIPATTKYRIVQVFKNPAPLCALIEAEIKTGRKHQIRKHFMMVGHPVVMDHVYGDKHFNRKFRMRFRLGRQFLHAFEISFMHPMLKKRVTIQAPLPMDLVSTLKKLSRA